MAGGRIDAAEVAAEESRLVALMAEIEPQLAPGLHAKVTDLLCELTVYNFMQAMLSLEKSRAENSVPRITQFQGEFRWQDNPKPRSIS